jgi:hypothetical protein
MVSLREEGAIAIVCPVISDSVAGVAIMTCEVLPCVGFPGDALPG